MNSFHVCALSVCLMPLHEPFYPPFTLKQLQQPLIDTVYPARAWSVIIISDRPPATPFEPTSRLTSKVLHVHEMILYLFPDSCNPVRANMPTDLWSCCTSLVKSRSATILFRPPVVPLASQSFDAILESLNEPLLKSRSATILFRRLVVPFPSQHPSELTFGAAA